MEGGVTTNEEATPVDGALPPALEPWDDYNRILAGHVRPAGWVNPQPAPRYHLVVIGAGPGGLVTAAIAAGLGARVALVERALLGGDCLNVGCVPSKALLAAARRLRATAAAEPPAPAEPPFRPEAFEEAMRRMRRIRAEIAAHDAAARFRGLGVDVFLGTAVFAGSDEVRVGDASLRFRRAVIAAGTHPIVPPLPGLSTAGCHTNETIFSLERLPRRLVVLGGGSTGCELAQAFAAFGCRVTLLEAQDRILTAEDPDAAALIADALRGSGVDVRVGVQVRAVESRGGARELRYVDANGEGHLQTDELFVCVGRAPNLEGLGLAAAGVRARPDRGVEVDDRLRTSNPRVYAVGDIASPLRLTHLADAHARLVVRNALFFGRGRASRLVVPRCTYTTPELAQVGLVHDPAGQDHTVAETLTLPLGSLDRARLEGEEAGFLRLHLAPRSDRILGATLVGEHAGEIIAQIAQAMTAGIGLDRLGETVFPYPTRAEVIRRAADQRRRGRLTPAVRRAFQAYFRWMR